MDRSPSKCLLALIGFLTPIVVIFWLMFLSMVYEFNASEPVGLHDVSPANVEGMFRSEWKLPTLRVREAAEDPPPFSGAADRWYRIVVEPADVGGLRESLDRRYVGQSVATTRESREVVTAGRGSLAVLRRSKKRCPAWWRPEELVDAEVVEYDGGVGGCLRRVFAFSEKSGVVYFFQEGH